MNVSLKWLRERVELGDRSVDEIARLLTFAGIEVEEIRTIGVASDQIVVAEIAAADPHPNADRLKVCQVDVGESELRQIVCGATNYQVGDRVPCALPGAKMPAGFEIGETKMRGVLSRGMLCSASEIGMVDAVDGLMILDSKCIVGRPVQEYFASDTLFTLEITPNRPDLLSHTGIARELSALFHSPQVPLAMPEVVTQVATADQIVCEDTTACPFYSLVSIKNVKVGPSPDWLAEKIKSIGASPINNVVDITNYVLHELGQPLHAFDAAKVTGPIHVRQSNSGEPFTALDGNPYELVDGDCVISDQSGSVLALGGIMGGEGSGVTDSSTDLLLEAAWFQPSTIRATSRRLGLTSDSSYRFERGVDPGGVLAAAAFATELIGQVCGGQPNGPIRVAGECPPELPPVTLDLDRLNQLMDGSIDVSAASDILTRLGLTQGADGAWEIPSWRGDLTRSIDLIEEVARVHGLDNVPSRVGGTAVDASRFDASYDQVLQLKRHLTALGFYESQTIKLIAKAQLIDALPIKPIQEGDVIRVSRPLSEDHAVMRPSLVPGLVATAERNIRRGVRELRFFEEGRQFRNAGGGKAKDLESDRLALFMSGSANADSWAQDSDRNVDLFDLKAVVQSLVPNHSIHFTIRPRDGFILAGDIVVAGKVVGVYAQLSPRRGREIGLDSPAFVAEMATQKLLPLIAARKRVIPLPQFPGSSRDIAMELPVEITNGDIENEIAKHHEPLLVSAHCFDMFRDATGEKLAVNRKSIAWSFSYRSEDRTLKSQEVDAAHQGVRDHLAKSLPVTFR